MKTIEELSREMKTVEERKILGGWDIKELAFNLNTLTIHTPGPEIGEVNKKIGEISPMAGAKAIFGTSPISQAQFQISKLIAKNILTKDYNPPTVRIISCDFIKAIKNLEVIPRNFKLKSLTQEYDPVGNSEEIVLFDDRHDLIDVGKTRIFYLAENLDHNYIDLCSIGEYFFNKSGILCINFLKAYHNNLKEYLRNK